MTVAIFNGLNRPENCHHYLAKERDITQQQLTEYRDHLEGLVEARTADLQMTNNKLDEAKCAAESADRCQERVLGQHQPRTTHATAWDIELRQVRVERGDHCRTE